MSQIKIAVVGAGPAGCTLALILHRAGIKCIIFEGEANANARNQGGTLDLHEGTGLTAMKRAGLEAEFRKHARYDGEALIVSNKHLRRFITRSGAKEGSRHGRPEIDRGVLRQMLVDALPPDTIQWNHKLRRIDAEDPSNITLHFDNKATQSGFDLIVGADGAWSKIRTGLLTTIRPAFAGMAMIRYTITSVATRHPALHKLVNRGSLFAFSDGKAITAQQMGDGTMSVGVTRTVPEDWLSTNSFHTSDLAKSKAATLTAFEDWDADLRALIEAADTELPWAANLYSLPIGTRWAHKPGVTLIGDAAHVMVPWAGEGVNVSVDDSVKLADAIIAATNKIMASKAEVGIDAKVLSDAVKGYEEEMFIRAGGTAAKSWSMMNAMFYETGAPDASVEKYVAAAIGDDVPWYLRPLVSAAANAYYAYFRWRWPGTGKC